MTRRDRAALVAALILFVVVLALLAIGLAR